MILVVILMIYSSCFDGAAPVHGKVSAKIQQLLNTLKRPKRKPLPEYFVDEAEATLESRCFLSSPCTISDPVFQKFHATFFSFLLIIVCLSFAVHVDLSLVGHCINLSVLRIVPFQVRSWIPMHQNQRAENCHQLLEIPLW